jgi:hypothetical protein
MGRKVPKGYVTHRLIISLHWQPGYKVLRCVGLARVCVCIRQVIIAHGFPWTDGLSG